MGSGAPHLLQDPGRHTAGASRGSRQPLVLKPQAREPWCPFLSLRWPPEPEGAPPHSPATQLQTWTQHRAQHQAGTRQMEEEERPPRRQVPAPRALPRPCPVLPRRVPPRASACLCLCHVPWCPLAIAQVQVPGVGSGPESVSALPPPAPEVEAGVPGRHWVLSGAGGASICTTPLHLPT